MSEWVYCTPVAGPLQDRSRQGRPGSTDSSGRFRGEDQPTHETAGSCRLTERPAAPPKLNSLDPIDRALDNIAARTRHFVTRHPRKFAAAVSIGWINIFANLAGYVGNHFIGWIKDRGATDRQCLFFLASCYCLGALIVSFVRTRLATHPLASHDAKHV